ncbi:adenylyl-sulfate kinase [Dyella dinghuensis]|uniref:Adenylyl-sulfate kinase n=1 Tax=Dyella dinghuensis TaxID=1920169 RepID=A0A432LVI8_9GAMM|nr:AAA family ATPase [Dyella dinghuensis]RUL66018.1 adenylyl-sulfate kinase [Dyella dinghuensis]
MTDRLGTVIYLAGPIGAGKTTVAQELVKQLAGPLTHIEGDKFWRFIATPAGKDRREHFTLLMRSMTAAALPFAKSGYTVLIDFSIPPHFLPTARKILKDIPLDYVVLKPDLDVCEARAANRAEGKIENYAPYHDFYALFDAHPRHVLSSDNVDARSMATRIKEELDMGAFRVPSDGLPSQE